MLSTPTPANDRSWSAVAATVSGAVTDRWRAPALEVPVTGHAPDAAEIARCSGDDVDGGAGVVDPVDRGLADADTEPFCRDDQLGVEEPLVVLDERQDLHRALAPDCLEAALEVGDVAA